MYVSSLLSPPPHPTPLNCHRAPDLGSLLHTASSHWPPALQMVICKIQCSSQARMKGLPLCSCCSSVCTDLIRVFGLMLSVFCVFGGWVRIEWYPYTDTLCCSLLLAFLVSCFVFGDADPTVRKVCLALVVTWYEQIYVRSWVPPAFR